MTVQMIQARNCTLSPRNVRRTAADPARLETLKASVEARGVLQNLIGFAIPKKRGKFEITAGGRRLAAVHGLIEAAILPADYEIPVFVMNDTSAAAETSLAENFERAAMNPADECVAFRHFIEVEGSTVEDIAKRFGLTTRFVEGRIRLAGLADDVFEALRSGDISLDVAQAFGTTTDVGRQARVYEQLKGGYNGIGIETMILSAALAEPLDYRASISTLVDTPTTDITELIDVLTNRVGDGRLYRVEPVASDVPERSVRRVAALAPDGGADWSGEWPRPSRLFRSPEPVETVALLPDHPPASFTWRGIRRRVRRADGPERVFGEWWKRDAERAAIRDYFQVEDDAGERFWLFRAGDGEDAGTGSQRWFIHGIFG